MAEEKNLDSDSRQPEKKSEEQPQVSFLDKARAAFNRAQISRYIGLLTVVTLTIVISIWSVGWNPAKIGWEKFLANTSLLLFLGIYGLFFGENEGGSYFKKALTGIYQVVRDAFLAIVEAIKRKAYIDSLPDYIVWRYQKDYEYTCKMKMLSVRVFDPSVCDLTDEQIETLRREPLEISESKHYSRLSEKQYNAVRAIKNGEIFVDYIDDFNFYLVEEASDGKQMVTQVKETDERKEKIKWQQRLSRIGLIALLALILAGFFIDYIPRENMTPEQLAEFKAQQIQAIKELFSRISCLIVSNVSGFHTARLLNLQDVFVLKYKISYLTVFEGCMDNKTFVPTDVETKAKEEYDKFKKEKEEALKNVVTPEPVLMIDSKEEKE